MPLPPNHRNSKVLHLAPPCALLLLRWTASASLEPPVAMVRLACYVRLPVYFELRSEGRLGPPRRSLNFEGLFVGRRTQTPDKYFAQTPTGTGEAFAQSAYVLLCLERSGGQARSAGHADPR